MRKVLAVNIPKQLKSTLIMGLNGFEVCFIASAESSLQFINLSEMDIILIDENTWLTKIHLEIGKELKKIKKNTPLFLLAHKDNNLKKTKGYEIIYKEELNPTLIHLTVVRSLENSKWAELSTQIDKTNPLQDVKSGLFNKQYLFMRLNEELERSRRYKFAVCVALVSIDQLDTIEKRHGAKALETTISEVGLLIQKNIRLSDIVCRYTEGHLAMLLPHTTVAESKVFWKRLSQVLTEQPVILSGKNYMLSFKFGVLPITLQTEHVDEKLTMMCQGLDKPA